MWKQTEFMKLVKQSALCYKHQTLDVSKRSKVLLTPSIKPQSTISLKSSFQSFHKEYLHDKFLKTESSMMTKSTEETNKNAIKLPQFFITKEKLDLTSRPYRKKEEKSQEPSSVYYPSFYPICTDEYRLYSNSRLREESINQFMEKTEVISKAKYFLAIKKEIQKEVCESTEVKIQSEQAKKQGLMKNKKLLDVFSNNFLLYLKLLNQEVEKERTELKALKAQHEILSSQIKNIKDKINSYKKQLIIGKEYKHFILLVKYHVTKISQLPLPVLIRHFGNDYCSRRPSMSPQRAPRVKKGTRLSTRKSDAFINSDDLKIYTQQSADFQSGGSNITEKEIFSTPEEFDHEYKEVEEKVLKMFISLNEKRRELITLRQKREEVIANKKAEEKITNDVLEEKESKLALIKRKYMMLFNEYDSIKHVFIEDTIKQKIKHKLQVILLDLPINIEKDLNFPFAYDHIKTKNNVLLVFGSKVNPSVYYLELLERILLVFIEKISIMKSNPKLAADYYKIKMALDVRKKIINSRLKIKAEKERRELMNEEIRAKNNKCLYVHHRKTNMTLTYIKKSQTSTRKKKKRKNQQGESIELSISDILAYD